VTPDAPAWDVVVVGAGPAGAATALAARHADPSLRVLLLDRAAFPRDKVCGDGVAPHVLDLLAAVGVTGLVDDRRPVGELRLSLGSRSVARTMARPALVVPRRLLDARLVEAAVAAGAVLRHARVRSLDVRPGRVVLDGTGTRAGTADAVGGTALAGAVVVGADGAHSVVARALGARPGPRAVALRGYAPVPPGRRGAQVIAFGTRRQPSYAWSFDRGDGLANVGYGEPVGPRAERLSKAEMLGALDELLPGAGVGATDWAAHPLPLSTWRPLRPGRGRVLLAGDAGGLVNPLTGEGIFYAVATGLLAGAAAAAAVRTGAEPATAYRHAVRALLGGHLRHTAAAARLGRSPRVLGAGLEAAAADQRVFDDLVELGLARGRLTSRLLAGLARRLGPAASPTRPPTARPASTTGRPAAQECP
jgi:geranylgeranyl reductase family protein